MHPKRVRKNPHSKKSINNIRKLRETRHRTKTLITCRSQPTARNDVRLAPLHAQASRSWDLKGSTQGSPLRAHDHKQPLPASSTRASTEKKKQGSRRSFKLQLRSVVTFKREKSPTKLSRRGYVASPTRKWDRVNHGEVTRPCIPAPSLLPNNR